ncbi:MAG: ABC transporter substrate-binding protein [Akkermansiaceae bacterium]|nr:ABC transporter substrate-binding protein [Armatimonadota bacterium]
MQDKSFINGRTMLWGVVIASILVTVMVSRARLIAAVQTSPSQGATRAGAPARIRVTYWHMWSGQWQPVMDRVVADFNASQDKYEVVALQVPYGQADSKLMMAVAGGDPPDVMTQWTQAVSTWSEDGILQPLETRMTPAERRFFDNDTFPVIHENGWHKGHLYGLVINVDVYACYYRPDDFRAAGLDPDKFPKTLEELIAIGRKLDQKDKTGRFTRLGFLPQGFTNYAPSFGGGFYDAATGQTLLDTVPNRRAMSFLVDTSKQLGLDKVRRFNSGLKSQNGAAWPFIAGSFAIALDGEWRVLQLAKFAPELEYRVAPLPPPAGGKSMASFSNTGFLTIPAGAKHPDGAWEFMKFWSGLDNPERSAKYNVSFGWLPSSPRMARSPDYQAFLHQYPQYQTFVDLAASPNIVTTPPVPFQLFLLDRISVVDDLAARGALSPAEALAKLEHDTARERSRRRGLGYE